MNDNDNTYKQTKGYTAKWKLKDSVFTRLFREDKYLLQLYQCLHPEDKETTAEDIKTITLEPVFINDLTNDLGFEVKGRIYILVEAQSTMSVNIIVRSFMYLARTYQQHFEETEKDLYSTKPVEMPKPELYVVYTGNKKIDKEVITLSEEFFSGEETAVEVRVKMITEKNGTGIISQFITFSKVINTQIKIYGRNDRAVKEAIRICKDEHILKEFVEEYEREVSDIMISLYDYDKALEIREKRIAAESRAEGRAEGEAKGRAEGEAKGRVKSLENVALTMLKEDYETSVIQKLTQLSLERINELKALCQAV